MYGNGAISVINKGMNMVRELRLSVFVVAFLLLQGCTDYFPVDTEIRTRYPVEERIVAIGDLHGDLDATRRAFRLAGAIDDEDHWIKKQLFTLEEYLDSNREGLCEAAAKLASKYHNKVVQFDSIPEPIEVLLSQHSFSFANAKQVEITPEQRKALSKELDRDGWSYFDLETWGK